MPTVLPVTVEHEYVYVDTRDYLDAAGQDVTDHWQAIVERCARDDDSDTRSFYSNSSVTTHQLRESRDRIIKALETRATAARVEGSMSGHTSNYDTNFYDNFGYSIVPLVRGGWTIGYLTFISLGDYHDSGLDIVLQTDSFEEAYETIAPTVGYYCTECEETANTTNGGYTWEANYGATEHKGAVSEGVVTCSSGHNVGDLSIIMNY